MSRLTEKLECILKLAEEEFDLSQLDEMAEKMLEEIKQEQAQAPKPAPSTPEKPPVLFPGRRQMQETPQLGLFGPETEPSHEIAPSGVLIRPCSVCEYENPLAAKKCERCEKAYKSILRTRKQLKASQPKPENMNNSEYERQITFKAFHEVASKMNITADTLKAIIQSGGTVPLGTPERVETEVEQTVRPRSGKGGPGSKTPIVKRQPHRGSRIKEMRDQRLMALNAQKDERGNIIYDDEGIPVQKEHKQFFYTDDLANRLGIPSPAFMSIVKEWNQEQEDDSKKIKPIEIFRSKEKEGTREIEADFELTPEEEEELKKIREKELLPQKIALTEEAVAQLPQKIQNIEQKALSLNPETHEENIAVLKEKADDLKKKLEGAKKSLFRLKIRGLELEKVPFSAASQKEYIEKLRREKEESGELDPQQSMRRRLGDYGIWDLKKVFTIPAIQERVKEYVAEKEKAKEERGFKRQRQKIENAISEIRTKMDRLEEELAPVIRAAEKMKEIQEKENPTKRDRKILSSIKKIYGEKISKLKKKLGDERFANLPAEIAKIKENYKEQIAQLELAGQKLVDELLKSEAALNIVKKKLNKTSADPFNQPTSGKVLELSPEEKEEYRKTHQRKVEISQLKHHIDEVDHGLKELQLKKDRLLQALTEAAEKGNQEDIKTLQKNVVKLEELEIKVNARRADFAKRLKSLLKEQPSEEVEEESIFAPSSSFEKEVSPSGPYQDLPLFSGKPIGTEEEKKICEYCESGLLPGAKICTICKAPIDEPGVVKKVVKVLKFRRPEIKKVWDADLKRMVEKEVKKPPFPIFGLVSYTPGQEGSEKVEELSIYSKAKGTSVPVETNTPAHKEVWDKAKELVDRYAEEHGWKKAKSRELLKDLYLKAVEKLGKEKPWKVVYRKEMVPSAGPPKEVMSQEEPDYEKMIEIAKSPEEYEKGKDWWYYKDIYRKPTDIEKKPFPMRKEDFWKKKSNEKLNNIIKVIEATKYQGKTVKLNDPVRSTSGPKKFHVFVKDPKTGKVKKVNFGDPDLSIKRDDPERRKSFRARHKCDQKKDKTTPGYWSCRMWEQGKKVSDLD